MNTKILAVGLVCLSAVAMGQSNAEKDKPKQTSPSKPVISQSGDPHEMAAPGDAAPGQATEKRMHKPITVTAEVEAHSSTSSKEVTKKEAADDWQSPAAKSADPHRVAPSMMSDGKAASASAVQPVKNTSSDSASVSGPRDMSTGQASGRERPRPIGSSGQDGVSTSREASSGMATGKKSATNPATGAQSVQPNSAPKK
jgi:hypothetical protein